MGFADPVGAFASRADKEWATANGITLNRLHLLVNFAVPEFHGSDHVGLIARAAKQFLNAFGLGEECALVYRHPLTPRNQIAPPGEARRRNRQ